MAGYSDTRQLIIDTLMGRPAGTEIQPEDHQAFALQITDYIRSVELVAGSGVPVGFAEPDTIPIQPDNGNSVYLSSVIGGTSKTFLNFLDSNGSSIRVDSPENSVTFLTLLWNGTYWSVNSVTLSSAPIILSRNSDSGIIEFQINGETVYTLQENTSVFYPSQNIPQIWKDSLVELYILEKFRTGNGLSDSLNALNNNYKFIIDSVINGGEAWLAQTDGIDASVEGKVMPLTIYRINDNSLPISTGEIIGYVVIKNPMEFRQSSFTSLGRTLNPVRVNSLDGNIKINFFLNPDIIESFDGKKIVDESVTSNKLSVKENFLKTENPNWGDCVEELYYNMAIDFDDMEISVLSNRSKLYLSFHKGYEEAFWGATEALSENSTIYTIRVERIYQSQFAPNVHFGDILGYVIMKDYSSFINNSVTSFGQYLNIPYASKLFYHPKIQNFLLTKEESKVDSILDYSKNLFDNKNVLFKQFVNGTSGIVNPAPSGQEAWWTSDFIPVKENFPYSINSVFGWAFYNIEKGYLSGANDSHNVNFILNSPTGAAFLRISGYYRRPDEIVLNEGRIQLDKDACYTSIKGGLLKNIANESINIFNHNASIGGFYINSSGNLVQAPAGQEAWEASDFIPVEDNCTYKLVSFGKLGAQGRDYAFYNEKKEKVFYKSEMWTNVTSPIGARYFRFSRYISGEAPSSEVMLVKSNENPSVYIPYGMIIKEECLPQNTGTVPTTSEVVEINLPEKINAVVGDTIQIFFRSIIKAVNPYNYDIVVNCNRGKMYPRYFEFTPEAVENIDFQVKIKNNNGEVLGTKTTVISVKSAISQPSENKNILFIGDSLTAAGIYTQEAFRRLTGTGGTPSGLGYSNISFVGRKTYGNIKAEGNSGWSWGDYLTTGRTAFTFSVNSVENIPTINSIYADDNGRQYTMWWDYSSSLLKFQGGTAETPPPASGKLTRVSGSGDSVINYSSVVQSSGNPFWNDELAGLDFPAYVNKWCGGKIDVVYTLLTWNGQWGNRKDFSAFTNYASTLYNHIHEHYPNVKIKMLGVQLPDLRQGERVDGPPRENTYTDMYGLVCTALDMNNAYEDFAKNFDYVEFVNVGSQVDSEYNMPYTAKPVNTRNSTTEEVGTNDVHPSDEGYKQIADVVFRNFVSNFCQ